MKQKKLLTLFLTVATSFSMLVACSNATFAESTGRQLLQKVQIRRTRNRKQMKIRMLQNNFWLI